MTELGQRGLAEASGAVKSACQPLKEKYTLQPGPQPSLTDPTSPEKLPPGGSLSTNQSSSVSSLKGWGGGGGWGGVKKPQKN